MRIFLLTVLSIAFANYCFSQKLILSSKSEETSVSKFPLLPIYPPFSKSSLVCEGKALKIGCKANEKIKIFSVFYGRNNHHTCPSNNNKFPAGGCVSKTAPAIVKKNCDGKSSCVLVAYNFALGGDPCFGTHKYLTVTWGCGNLFNDIFKNI